MSLTSSTRIIFKMLPLLAGLSIVATSQPPRQLDDIQKCVVDGCRWEARIFFVPKSNKQPFELELWRNGKLYDSFGDATLWGTRFLKWPFGGRLLAVSSHTGCGHGMGTSFYTLRHGVLKDTSLDLDGELGGPMFKDLNHDGRPEMIFDNYDYYRSNDDRPTAFKVYKVLKNGKIKFWKTMPNPKRLHVRRQLPFVSE
jgi:hypothetical protein